MENLLKNLSPEDKKRTAYIEGREDLFETKILDFSQSTSESNIGLDKKNILIISRDPGSANALIPVIKVLQKDPHFSLKAITDGRAKELFEKRFKTKDITPKDTAFADATVINKPDLLLINPSVEPGLDIHASGTFIDTPIVLLEDSYTSWFSYLGKLKSRGLRLPEKICVMDEGAKKIILLNFPELDDRIIVTGQPSFDRFATEDTEALNKKTRKDLGLNAEETIITFMSSLEGVDFMKELAKSMTKNEQKFTFILRRHPRDNTTYHEYEKIFNDMGIKLFNTNHIDTDSIGAMSDIIITSTSTETINAIYRRKPTLNIVDKKLDLFENRTIPPNVETGASAGITDIRELSNILPELLNKDSKLNRDLKENMDKYYPQDGKNTERVVAVINEVINRKIN